MPFKIYRCPKKQKPPGFRPGVFEFKLNLWLRLALRCGCAHAWQSECHWLFVLDDFDRQLAMYGREDSLTTYEKALSDLAS